jgi:N-acetylmuramoyl-L-alanine amidase
MSSRHVVGEGEGLSKIAEQYGASPAAVWEDPGNEALRGLRSDPNVLLPGDVLVIPDKSPKIVPCATGVRHRFRRVGVPALYELLLLDEEDAPRAGVPYTLTFGDQARTGKTGDDGVVRQWLPCATRTAALTFGDGEDAEEYELDFTLRPVVDVAGVQQRLRNLGFACPQDGDPGGETATALAAFQTWAGLPATGLLDDDTASALRRLHDEGETPAPGSG